MLSLVVKKQKRNLNLNHLTSVLPQSLCSALPQSLCFPLFWSRRMRCRSSTLWCRCKSAGKEIILALKTRKVWKNFYKYRKFQASMKTFEQVWIFWTSMKLFRSINLLKQVGIFWYYPRFENEESMKNSYKYRKFRASMQKINLCVWMKSTIKLKR